jgi:serine/threonine protein kinase
MAENEDREALLRIVERRRDLDGRFVNIKRLGASGGYGNFSLLFSAYDKVTLRDVALKFYNPFRLLGSDVAYRFGCFEREAKILEALSGERDVIGWLSPIKAFTERFDAGGISFNMSFSYFGLELAQTDLAAMISSSSLSPGQLLDVYRVMCRSVRRLHQLGYTHRDLKPSNFLMMPDGTVRLSDLGTARKMDAASPQLSPAYIFPPGELTYASPEALAALLDDDPRLAYKADVFALGAVLFEMVTGTVLGLHLFDQRFRTDLTQMMAVIARGKRKDTFDSLVLAIADGHPLPNLFAFAPTIPPSILPLLDDLYKQMSHLDYRRRLCDFDRIWLRIESCSKVLRNEEAYRKWRDAKRLYKAARERKLEERRQRVTKAAAKESI